MYILCSFNCVIIPLKVDNNIANVYITFIPTMTPEKLKRCVAYIFSWQGLIGFLAIIVCLKGLKLYNDDWDTEETILANLGRLLSDHLKLNDWKHRQINKGIDRLILDLKELLLEGHYSDAVLKAGQHEFRVHKAVLAARSPIFASMFQQVVTEGPIPRYAMPDYPPETFNVFLHYLYTGIPIISLDNVFDLYSAAEMYEINDLKVHCLLYMIQFLSVDNFCHVMTLTLRHGQSNLKKVATRFFNRNIQKIIKTVQWKKFSNEYPLHANELLNKHLLLKNDN